MRIEFAIENLSYALRFGFVPDDFTWKPGLIESGDESPCRIFDTMAEEYWRWGWLGLTVFFARARL